VGRKRPQLDCRDVKRLLRLLGFEAAPRTGTSHEKFKGYGRGQARRVYVDCPKAPFSPDLIKSMASQAGVTVSEFYEAADGSIPADWPGPVPPAVAEPT